MTKYIIEGQNSLVEFTKIQNGDFFLYRKKGEVKWMGPFLMVNKDLHDQGQVICLEEDCIHPTHFDLNDLTDWDFKIAESVTLKFSEEIFLK